MRPLRLLRGLAHIALALSLASAGVLAVDALQQPTLTPAPLAGDAACLSCHQAESTTYQHTAHHLTSQLAAQHSILGSFTPPANHLAIAQPAPNTDDPRLSFDMTETSSGFFQTATAETATQHLTHTARMDIVFGSGTRGQTYLSWIKSGLFELPVSFWTEGHQWINSPGYRDGTANFDRHVNPRCIECHATAITPLSPDPQTNQYDRASFVPGISCETCHGSGAAHVALEHTAHKPGQTAILNPAHFSRDRQIDACALCHNGTSRTQLRAAFTYQPGEDLTQYLAPSAADLVDHPDVHGNQVGLLKRSRCFLRSPQMTCSTCHQVHAPERAAASYSQQCLTCHQWQACGASKQLGSAIKRDCISCHMPLQQTDAIVSETAGRLTHTSIRTHWIKVYPTPASPATN